MTSERPWSRTEFEAELRRLEPYYHAHHPYQRLMSDGALTRAQLQGWVANRYYYQVSVPVKDAALLANCPDPEIRRVWVQRLFDHDGDADRGGGGIEAWIQLGLAVGLTRQEIVSQRHVLPGVRFAVDAYVNFVRRADWLDGVCSSLTELFAPTIHQQRLAGWPRHYPWIDPRGLDYFRNRIGQAHRDVEHGLEIVLARCDTAAKQRRAVDILGFKLEVLWTMLDAMYMAYVMQMPPFHDQEEVPWAPLSTATA